MATDAVGDIRDRLDIVELVQGYVPDLKKTGRSFKGLCPFHQEKSPSFVVFPDSQNFHCFGCGKGGDLFTFHMLVENIEFRESLRELAQRAGVQLDSAPTPAPEVDAHRARLIEANELAAKWYAHILKKAQAGAAGREVIESRQVSGEMVEQFQLGFAPDSWDALLNFMASRGFDGELLHESGLAQQRDSGGFYDRFRNRLMFPIRDREGSTVGFGARAIGDAIPKYLNSPQTPIFDKSAVIYGLDLAKTAIRNAEEVVIVEGYMDAIAAHQFGYTNVVASMGTALTEAQVGLIKRGSKRIVLALDADAAGQMATIRGLDTMRDALDGEATPVPDAMGMVRFERKLKTEIAIAQIPEDTDPDELIRTSPDRWPEVIAKAQPFLDFTIETLTRGVSGDDARAKSDVVKQVAPLLQQVPDRIVQGHYVSLLSRKLSLDERLVLSEVRRAKLGARPRAERQGLDQAATARAKERSTEVYLIALLVRHHELTADLLDRINIDDVLDARNRELLMVLRDPATRELTAEQIIVGLSDELASHVEGLLETLEGRPEQFPGQIQQETDEVIRHLGRERGDFLKKQLAIDLESALQEGDRTLVRTLMEQRVSLAERQRQYDPLPSPYFRDSRSQQQ